MDVEVASKLLTFLEDRRVLFNPLSAEIPDHVTSSVLQIRERLNTDLQAINAHSDLANALRGMRAACHKFLDAAQELNLRHNLWLRSGVNESLFMDALGQFRGVMGVYIAKLAATYQLDVEGDLATILPPADSDE